jgi:hypothetical protein
MQAVIYLESPSSVGTQPRRSVSQSFSLLPRLALRHVGIADESQPVARPVERTRVEATWHGAAWSAAA